MTQLVKIQRCLIMRNGLEIWIDEEKAEIIGNDLVKGQLKGILKIEGRYLNTVDIIGIFTAEDVSDLTCRKNGQWKCENGQWHDKNKKCDCVDETKKEMDKLYPDFIKK